MLARQHVPFPQHIHHTHTHSTATKYLQPYLIHEMYNISQMQKYNNDNKNEVEMRSSHDWRGFSHFCLFPFEWSFSPSFFLVRFLARATQVAQIFIIQLNRTFLHPLYISMPTTYYTDFTSSSKWCARVGTGCTEHNKTQQFAYAFFPRSHFWLCAVRCFFFLFCFHRGASTASRHLCQCNYIFVAKTNFSCYISTDTLFLSLLVQLFLCGFFFSFFSSFITSVLHFV